MSNLDKIRKLMEEENVDVYLIPTLDPHASEYLPDHYAERKFISGFTGSAGTVLITKDNALLWTDGRYFIQAENQLYPGFKLMKMGHPDYPTLSEWLSKNIKSGTIGFNYLYYTEALFENLKENLSGEIKFKDADLIGALWKDRPSLPQDKIFIHELKYTGKTAEEKLKEVRSAMKKEGADTFVLAKLDDIAWLYNLRGKDIEANPVFMSYAIVDLEGAKLFVDREKIKNVLDYTKEFSQVYPYEEVFNYAKTLKDKNILLNKESINKKLYDSLQGNKIINKANPTEMLKAVKNEIEIKNEKEIYIKDCLALTKFIKWIKENPVNEYEAGEKLLKFRQEQEGFLYPSFATIGAYGKNAAMMHYSASKENNTKLEKKGFFLVDSGGQYYGGTTDTTRTIAMGPLSQEEIRDYTYVLKAHLMLQRTIFLKGTDGISLDGITRYNIWQHHMDYKCGTGHGVGYFLNVHEGPHGISPSRKTEPMVAGMYVSDEPGIYKENKHGIRIENILLVVDDGKYDDGQFLKFESLCYLPYELDVVDKNLLTEEEIDQLNEYHKKTYEKLSPYLEGEELEFLKKATREI